MSITVCLRHATREERFAEDMDCSSFAGQPIRFGTSIVGTVLRAWVDEGSLWAELSIASPEMEEFLVSRSLASTWTPRSA